MKKIIVILTSVTLLLSMAACQQKSDGKSGARPSTPITTENAAQVSSRAEVKDAATTHERATVEEQVMTVQNGSEEILSVSEEAPANSAQPTQEATHPLHAHSYSATIIEPTCTDKGYTEYICACGDSYKDNFTATLGHSFIDEVIAPTFTDQGYTRHTCQYCGCSLNDTYTDVLPTRWDTEEAVANLCAMANAYIESVGCVVDPNSGCWVAPRYTGVKGVDQATCYYAVLDEIDTYRAEGKTHLFVYYLPYADAFQIYVAYNIIIGG